MKKINQTQRAPSKGVKCQLLLEFCIPYLITGIYIHSSNTIEIVAANIHVIRVCVVPSYLSI